MLIALVATENWYIIHINFIAAYFNGKLKENIYIKTFLLLNEYFKDYPKEKRKYVYINDNIIYLLNPLYGLKQAGTAWQERTRDIMKRHGFVPLKADDTIY